MRWCKKYEVPLREIEGRFGAPTFLVSFRTAWAHGQMTQWRVGGAEWRGGVAFCAGGSRLKYCSTKLSLLGPLPPLAPVAPLFIIGSASYSILDGYSGRKKKKKLPFFPESFISFFSFVRFFGIFLIIPRSGHHFFPNRFK